MRAHGFGRGTCGGMRWLRGGRWRRPGVAEAKIAVLKITVQISNGAGDGGFWGLGTVPEWEGEAVRIAPLSALGSEWTDAWKLGKDYSPAPKSARRWYYGERSVFEVTGG
jgi:hypothetical protein